MSSSADRCPTCHRAYRKDRSNQQNRYYWGVVLKALGDHTGYTPDEIHEFLKQNFLHRNYIRIVTKKGTPLKANIVRSTTDLTTTEFEDFMTKVRQWASLELSCWIPEPNEEIGDE